MHAYVINLERSAERRVKVTANLDRCGIDYEIVTAVDGRDLDPAGNVVPGYFDKYRPGEAGCALSHMAVYRKVLEAGEECALVLEDDIIVPPELTTIAGAAAKELEGAEVALLNFDSEEIVKVSKIDAVNLPAGRQLLSPVDVRQPSSTASYIITREACARMLDRVFPVETTADDWARFIQAGGIDRLWCVVPLAVRKDPAFGSTLDYYSSTSLKARLLAVIDRLGLGLVQRLVTYRRARIWRRYTRVEFVDEPTSRLPSGRRP